MTQLVPLPLSVSSWTRTVPQRGQGGSGCFTPVFETKFRTGECRGPDGAPGPPADSLSVPTRTPTPGLLAVRPAVLTAPPSPRTVPTRRRRESAGKPEVEMGQPDGKRGHTGQGKEAPALTSSRGAAVPRGRGRERAGRGGALDGRTGQAVGRQPITVARVGTWAGRRRCLGDALRRPSSAG